MADLQIRSWAVNHAPAGLSPALYETINMLHLSMKIYPMINRESSLQTKNTSKRKILPELEVYTT